MPQSIKSPLDQPGLLHPTGRSLNADVFTQSFLAMIPRGLPPAPAPAALSDLAAQ